MMNKAAAVKIGGAVLIIALLLSGCFGSTPAPKRVDLTFYGLDNSDAWSGIISDYEKKHGNVHIKYKKFNDAASFESLVVNEIAEGEGPDVFYLHNTWLPRHIKKIVPLQSQQFTVKQFPDAYVNVTAEDFIQKDPNDGNQKIYALPLYVDTLALYYNKKQFEKQVPERGKPGSTWDALKDDAVKLRQLDKDGKLTQGEVAVGRGDNIGLAVDILYNMFLQSGDKFYDSSFKNVQLGSAAANQFDSFLSFAAPQSKNFSWNADLVSSTEPTAEVQAFLSGKVSAIFGYSDLYQRLDTELRNLKTRFFSAVSMSDVGVALSPQISSDKSDYRVWADYYGLAVSRNSKNAAAAWDFVQFAGSKNQAKTYHDKTKRPTARRDLIEDQMKEPITDVFVSQVGYAGSFHIFSDQKFEDILKEAISLSNSGQTSRSALDAAVTKMNEILKTEAPQGLYPPVKKK